MFFDYKPKRVVRPPTAYATAGLAVINSDKSDAGTPKGRCCCAEWAVFQSETARFVVQDSPFRTAIRPALTMPKFTSHFSYSFTAIVYILEHPLLNDFTALEKCP